jgi:trimeric autotransporter adhesin
MSKFVKVFIFAISLCLVFGSTSAQTQTTWISNLTISTTSTTASLTWTTAVPASTQARYGLTTSYGTHTSVNPSLVTSHAAMLTGLSPNTLYHLRVVACDSEPLVLTSNDYTFTTQAGVVGVSVTPSTGVVTSGASEQLTAQVTNASNTAVTWSASLGSVTTAGMFTAPVTSTNEQAVVTATSVADPSKSASAVFTVQPPIQHSVTLGWQASTSNNIAFYSAYRSLTHGGPYGLISSAITGLGYTDATVQAGATYYYVVTATDNTGQESADSVEVAAAVPIP